MIITACFIIGGLILGGFIYEAFTEKNWGRACEISWYQTTAIIIYILLTR